MEVDQIDVGSDLEEKVIEISRNTVSAKSRAVYAGKKTAFLIWLDEHVQHVLSPSFLQQAESERNANGSLKRAFVKKIIDNSVPPAPVLFDLLTAHHIKLFITSLKKADGFDVGSSTHNTARSSIRDLFRSFNVTMPENMQQELETYFKGLKRVTVARQAQGKEKIQVGKSPMEFSLLCYLARRLLESGRTDDVFAHLYLVLSWNLMCRAGNTANICYAHLDWSQDSLLVYFAHTKSDPEGQRPKDPRHVYANPLQPSICCLLSLGIYLLCFQFEPKPTRLFSGKNQYERYYVWWANVSFFVPVQDLISAFGPRYSKALNRLLQRSDVQSELELRGLHSHDIATHSTRKGAATYVSSGSTAAPPQSAVFLRAGWALGGVQDRYIRYEAAGDQYVGRTAAGLPINDASFAILPPHFIERDAIVQDALKLLFPGAPANISPVSEFALASVVFHREFLRATLPKHHRLFSSILFRDEQLLGSLASRVLSGLPTPSGVLRATGIPPHVNIIEKMEAVQDGLHKILPAISNIPPEVVKGVDRLLEQKAVNIGAVTRSGVEDVLMNVLDKTGLLKAVHDLKAGVLSAHSASSSSSSSAAGATERKLFKPHMYDGHFHRVPQNFDFPAVGTLLMWQHYVCGDPGGTYPPLRDLKAKELPSRNLKKRLSDLNFLMKPIEAKLRADNLWKNSPSFEEANQMFLHGQTAIMPSVPNQRKRRYAEIQWRTVVNALRGPKRRVATEHDGPNDDN